MSIPLRKMSAPNFGAMSHEQKVDTDLLYYNASLFVPQTSQPIPASIVDSRTSPIIARPEDWEVSVVRFDLSANLLPPMVLPMPGPPAAGTVPSSLVITLRNGGFDYAAAVQIFSGSIETYGFVYSIADLMDNFNVAAAAAFAAMPPVAGVTSAPVFALDPATQLISCYFQSSYATAPVEIWLNASAYQYVESMPASFAGYNNPSGRDFQLQLSSSLAAALPPVGAARAGLPVAIAAMGDPARRLPQQGVSLASMNGVRSVFITTTMPINSESIPATNGINQNANVGSNNMPILSDFLLGADPSNNPVVDRISIEYLPTAEYRMVQLRGRAPLTLVDLKFWYTLFDGRIFELRLPPGGFASAKLMFRRVR